VTGEWKTLTWREYTERLIAAGWRDDEIVVRFGDGPIIWDEGIVLTYRPRRINTDSRP
jgi:hypothetical protein